MAIRIRKRNKIGNPALKITLSSDDDVNKVIRANKKSLKARKLYMSNDLTPLQIVNLKKMKQKIQERRSNGENVGIKYVKGKPVICELKN